MMSAALRSGPTRWLILAVAAILASSACGKAPYTLDAVGPFSDAAVVTPSLERVAILVTITNQSGSDLQINPADFVARDAQRRIYAANASATVADARLVSRPSKMRGSLPLPTITLRSDDVLSGFVVFDVPAGVQPVELIWRQSDTDSIAMLSAAG
jgi:Domain of unknown function (DUF4352)